MDKGGRPMVHPAIIRQILTMLDEGWLTQQEIAKRCGVCQGTVSKISRNRTDYERILQGVIPVLRRLR